MHRRTGATPAARRTPKRATTKAAQPVKPRAMPSGTSGCRHVRRTRNTANTIVSATSGTAWTPWPKRYSFSAAVSAVPGQRYVTKAGEVPASKFP